MPVKAWEKLPENMKCDEVRKYYNILSHRKASLIVKRIFDVLVSFIMICILSPILLILSLLIALDSKGPVFFRQLRVTSYGREFRIFKFRTMVTDAEKLGTQVTVKGDSRVTRMGKLLRGCRLDELPQLFNILLGDMTFVGTRPEVPRYVAKYTPEMMATLLLPAGVTSEASIFYKDEDRLLDASEDVEKTYTEEVLPGKMYYNLRSIEEFSFFHDIRTMFRTVLAVCGKEYSPDK